MRMQAFQKGSICRSCVVGAFCGAAVVLGAQALSKGRFTQACRGDREGEHRGCEARAIRARATGRPRRKMPPPARTRGSGGRR